MKSWASKVKLLSGVAIVALCSATTALAQTRSFDVPADKAVNTIPEFARQAGIQIVSPADGLDDVRTHAVQGSLDLHAALSELLEGTGIEVASENGQTIMLRVQPKNAEAASNEGAANNSGLETVVVTGTHLRGVNVTSPLVIITKKEIDESGAANVGEVINRMPQAFGGGQQAGLVATVGGAAGNNLGNSGAIDSPNLRGLGSQATLTLFDGLRLAPDAQNSTVDASMVPLGLIDHVEVLTDGASAIYGADAVAGVVNLVPRKDFDGQESNIVVGDTTQGGAFEVHADQLFGRVWDGGNVMASYSYSNQNALRSRDRDYTTTPTSDALTTLIPGSTRNSLFLDVNQDVAPDLTAFFEGIYTNRHTTLFLPLGGGTGYQDSLKLDQYALNGGFRWRMFSDWESTLSAATSTEDLSALPTVVSNLEISENEVDRVEANATGSLLDLPWGAVHASFGVGYQHQFLNHTEGPGSIYNITRSRDQVFAYAEIQAPLVEQNAERVGLERLELNAAVRWEHYSDFGSSTNPKIGILYSPLHDLEFKGSWGTSFRPPTLSELALGVYALAYPFPDPNSPTQTTNTLYLNGGNPTLRPETATSWSASGTYSPTFLSGLRIDATYFRIGYKNLILAPLDNPFGAYADPFAAPFVTLNPPTALVQAFVNSAWGPRGLGFDNPLGLAVSQIAGIVDDRYANVASQRSEGVDLTASYTQPLDIGQLTVSAGTTWNTLTQQLFTNLPRETLSGTVYNTPKFKSLANIGWEDGAFGVIATINYVSGEEDTFNSPSTRISPWTTADLQLSWSSSESLGPLNKCRVSFSVLNIFDSNPPMVDNIYTQAYGPNYDPTNASPLGRTVRLQLTGDW